MIEQRSEEWLKLRMGKFTASEIHRLMGKKGLGLTGETYILEKVSESLGVPIPIFVTKAMEYGTLTEPIAKFHYERAMKVSIKEQPFIIPDWCDQAGCSPDGVVKYRKYGIEIKCPQNPVNHIQYLLLKNQEELKDQFPQYYWHIMMCLAVTKLKKWQFISYHEDFQGELKMAILNVLPNQDDIDLLKSRILEAVEIKNKFLKQILR